MALVALFGGLVAVFDGLVALFGALVAFFGGLMALFRWPSGLVSVAKWTYLGGQVSLFR